MFSIREHNVIQIQLPSFSDWLGELSSLFMHIISRKKLSEFSQIHADAAVPLDNWYRIAKAAEWKYLVEVRCELSSAEAVGNFTVFNIKGNEYRLIVSIDYERQLIYIKYILTHAEYDKEKWKNDPYY